MKSKILAAVLASAIFLPAVGSARPSKKTTAEEAKTTVSFILIGQPPGKIYQVSERGEISRQAPEKGSAPPTRIIVRSPSSDIPVRLPLNSISQPVTLEPGTSQIRISSPPDGDSPGSVLAELPVSHPGKAQSVILYKATPDANWNEKLATFATSDDPQMFPARSIRFINLSRIPLRCQVGEKSLEIQPGDQSITSPDSSEPLVNLSVTSADGEHTAVKTGRMLQNNDRLTIVVADGGNPDKTTLLGTILVQRVPQAAPSAK